MCLLVVWVQRSSRTVQLAQRHAAARPPVWLGCAHLWGVVVTGVRPLTDP